MDRAAHALALTGEISSAPTVAKAVDAFEHAVEPFGVRLYRAGVLSNPLRDVYVSANVTNWSNEWRAFYEGAKAFTFDPVLAASRRGASFFWRDLDGLRADSRALMRAASDAGMIQGFTAVRGSPGELKTAVNLAGDLADWTDLEQGVVSLIANVLMSRILYLREVHLAPEIQAMSSRELEILLHAAAGRHDKVIARQLGLSPETVRGYWKTIRRKLGAADRAHAVAIGLWSGQISP